MIRDYPIRPAGFSSWQMEMNGVVGALIKEYTSSGWRYGIILEPYERDTNNMVIMWDSNSIERIWHQMSAQFTIFLEGIP